MTDWIRLQNSVPTYKGLGPLQLAWLGDSVWELHQKLRQCKKAGRSKDLHLAVVAEVRASSQVKALDLLEPFLSEAEKEMVRRGRNKSGRGPRNCEPAVYAKSTGFETMVGWLFLKDPTRLAQLLDRLEESESKLDNVC